MDSFIWSLRNHIGLHHFEGQVQLWIIFLVMTANMLRFQRLKKPKTLSLCLKAQSTWIMESCAARSSWKKRWASGRVFSMWSLGCCRMSWWACNMCHTVRLFLTFSSLSDLECLRWCCHTQKKDAMASREMCRGWSSGKQTLWQTRNGTWTLWRCIY